MKEKLYKLLSEILEIDSSKIDNFYYFINYQDKETWIGSSCINHIKYDFIIEPDDFTISSIKRLIEKVKFYS